MALQGSGGREGSMTQKHVEEPPLSATNREQATVQWQPVSTRAIQACVLAFVLCILVMIAPLHRFSGTTLLLQLPTNILLLPWGTWLPSDLHLTPSHRASQLTTNIIEFLLLMALAFMIYGICALLIQRKPAQGNHSVTFRSIWLGAIVTGLIFVLAPAMPSHDIFAYAGYGRIIAAHHANPYFVPLAAFPQDPFNAIDDWRYASAAYGPLWLAICALWAFVLGNNPLHYIIVFRLFAFACHLLNIWLVSATLRAMGRSPRTIASGTLLYAWNPLVVFESCLGGHNDILMLTCMLTGIFLSVRAEQRGFASPRSYLAPTIAFTLTALIKFTTLPLIVFFLVLLARKTLFTDQSAPLTYQQPDSLQRRPALLAVLIASTSSAGMALILYMPFWIGHSMQDIVSSFSTPPSARFAFKSILHGIVAWNTAHSLPTNPVAHTLLSVFGSHSAWNAINIAAFVVELLVGAIYVWRVPTTHSIAFATLATLSTLLVLTPWFFPWYLIWIVGLAAVCLPMDHFRIGRGLLAFTLTFSASSLLTYLFNGYPPMGGWIGLICLTTIGPPLAAFFVSLLLPNAASRALPENAVDT